MPASVELVPVPLESSAELLVELPAESEDDPVVVGSSVVTGASEACVDASAELLGGVIFTNAGWVDFVAETPR